MRKVKQGREIVCYGCGGRGGTLIKIDDGVYAHAGCDWIAMRKAREEKARMEADRKEAETKEKILLAGLVEAKSHLHVARAMLPQKKP
jgi:hypothetical protein